MLPRDARGGCDRPSGRAVCAAIGTVRHACLRLIGLGLTTGVLITPLAAFDAPLPPQALGDAVALGQTGIESRRTEFHRPYHIPIGRAPLDEIEVTTPFRRVVLAAEATLRAGQRLFGQREAYAVLGDSPELVEVALELTFHPLNTLMGVPSYDVRLERVGGAGEIVVPTQVERIPRFGPRVQGVPRTAPGQGVGVIRGGSQPMLGGTVLARLDGRVLDHRGVYDVVISEAGREVARGRVDLAALK